MPLRAVANRGQIPIARGLLEGRAQCFPHLGSDPDWRVGVNGDPRPGGAPGGAVTFFCVAKRKSPKKRPPPLPASSAALRKPAVLASDGVWLNSLRSNNASPFPPEAVLLGASRGGPRGAGSVALCATSRLGREPGRAGLGVRSRVHAVWRRRVAQGWADQGWRCLSAASLARPRPDRATQRTGTQCRAATSAGLFFGDFLLATQKKVTALPGARPGLLMGVNQRPGARNLTIWS
ncbi:hypothetical protein os1_26690 [Comamonadaceae bacterium OS-1]|nr:hypothetical protein os1_26690 [Comamonadaceae bacterium OS-1]